MVETLQRYGTGAGIPLGAGVGATAAVIAGAGSELAVLAGFGACGGLVVGGVAGQFAETALAREHGALRVLAFTLFVALLAGGLLGALAAWTGDARLADGALAGGAAGGTFALLLSGVLVATGGRQPEPGRP